MISLLKNFYRIISGSKLIIKSTFQTRIFIIGFFLLFRFYIDILFIFLINKVRYNKINYSFKNFKFNSKKFFNCKFYNLKSENFFYKNKSKIKYDLVSIDGSHFYKDVLNDALNSFKILKKNGIIIFDDFLYTRQTTRLKHAEYKNVIGGILYFLKRKKVKIIYVGHQVIIKKI
jgi:hypothetical protein